jgi:hypothetical protein
MEITDETHVPTTLPPWNDSPVSIEEEDEWAPIAVWSMLKLLNVVFNRIDYIKLNIRTTVKC